MRAAIVLFGLILAAPVSAQPSADARHWQTSDAVLAVRIPAGWRERPYTSETTQLVITSPEMTNTPESFAACSVNRDVVPIATRTQDEANRIAGEWADEQALDHQDAVQSEEQVGAIRVVAVSGWVEANATRYRDSTRFFQIGHEAGATSYMLTCRIGPSSQASEPAVSEFLNSLTINAAEAFP